MLTTPETKEAALIRDALTQALRETLVTLGVDPLPESIALERPARREHGDWSSNVALATAKAAGRKPRELAGEIAEQLNDRLPLHVQRVEVAGPGFVNFLLDDTWLHGVLGDVVEQGVEAYARSELGAGRRVLVEFVSANPTGPVHAGHGRGAAYGDSLARILERIGHDVRREFYINDRGVQMASFAASLTARKHGVSPPEDGYHGDYITEWAAEMPDDADPHIWGEERALSEQRETLARMNVRFDNWFSEQSMVDSGAIDTTLADLRERGVVYEGNGAVWLRSTAFGDDKDRVLVKTNGEPTYLLPDIAYHRDKFARGFDLLIDVWGADHHGYVARMKAAVQALGHDPDELELVITQLVNLVKGGEPVRLSKRTGDIIELREVLDEVGPDPARLTYLLQSVDSQQTFDMDVVVSESMENPVYYVQMAHARIRSIERVAAEREVERVPWGDVDLSPLSDERELEILRQLEVLPETLLVAASERAPHKITSWVRELAGAVHRFYHDCPILRSDIAEDLRQARLWLVEAARIGLRIGLDLLGLHAPESM
ncbi:MAG: Arginine--tRNA ligase [Acidimicrobiales bacterium]|nr:MAG: arginine--tRNA ligase [Actinomycetota bacterium]MBV6508868.1 Arginine--tRNA ligase [Acidimicrobiales bacterium]RIK04996.1 MAG: arginine--tRNA ligase [Acidobacteriota bacterium]